MDRFGPPPEWGVSDLPSSRGQPMEPDWGCEWPEGGRRWEMELKTYTDIYSITKIATPTEHKTLLRTKIHTNATLNVEGLYDRL